MCCQITPAVLRELFDDLSFLYNNYKDASVWSMSTYFHEQPMLIQLLRLAFYNTRSAISRSYRTLSCEDHRVIFREPQVNHTRNMGSVHVISRFPYSFSS
jgi:hypothetical protein